MMIQSLLQTKPLMQPEDQRSGHFKKAKKQTAISIQPENQGKGILHLLKADCRTLLSFFQKKTRPASFAKQAV
jgi:hypothetical protein